jgi:hypothetical protein
MADASTELTTVMESFRMPTGFMAWAEMGDKTHLDAVTAGNMTVQVPERPVHLESILQLFFNEIGVVQKEFSSSKARSPRGSDTPVVWRVEKG